jgi:DnaK suppressor protein
MTTSALARYRTLLKAKEGELVEALKHREGIAIQRTADTLDEVLLAGERELVIRNLDREARLLRDIRSALARMEEGSYGICLSCEEAINPRRLDAVPWASYCVVCQDAIDRHALEPDVASPSRLNARAA